MKDAKVVRRDCVRRRGACAALFPALFPASCLFVVAVVACLLAPGGAAQEGVGWTGTRHGAAGKDLNAVYFSDSKRGWMAGDGGLVFRTEDGGRSWIQQSVGTNEQINDLYFRDKEDGYLIAGSAILITADSG